MSVDEFGLDPDNEIPNNAVQAGAAAICEITAEDGMRCPVHDVWAGPTSPTDRAGIEEEFGIPADLELDGTFCLWGWKDAAAVLSAAEPIWRAQVAKEIEGLERPLPNLRVLGLNDGLRRAAALVRGSE